MTARGDQLVCQFCGKSFPLNADGDASFRAHQVAELAIEAECAMVDIDREGTRRDESSQKLTGQLQLPFPRSERLLP